MAKTKIRGKVSADVLAATLDIPEADLTVVGYPLKSLKPDPNNVNVHNERNLDAIEKSLLKFGQVEPLLVQKSTGMIIGGNGRYDRMCKLNRMKKFPADAKVILLDIDDAKARMLAVALNRTAQLSNIDHSKVAEILSMVANAGEDVANLGYSQVEMNLLIERAAKQAAPVFGLVDKAEKDVTLETSGIPTQVARMAETLESEEAPAPPKTVSDTTAANDPEAVETNSIEMYNVNILFPSKEIFEIPPIRKDMCMPCPDDLVVYTGYDEIGLATQPKGENQLNIWGTFTPKDGYANKLIGYYIWDDKFEESWYDAANFTRKLVARKPLGCIAPNYTPTGNTAQKIFCIHQCRWVARFWQEAGIKVIPDAHLSPDPDHWSYYWAGIPKGAPCVAVQIQTAKHEDDRGVPWKKNTLKEMLNRLEPETLLIYGDIRSEKRMNMLDGILPNDLKIVVVDDFTTLRMRYIRERDKAKKAAEDAAKPAKSPPAKKIVKSSKTQPV